ncbi:acetyl-CoA carboxylase biotin carboxyl carrier protein [Oscillospiraceae bacterium MB08-C2-2]|nr:acetyl-CoA carboxylase biotin carboxyl carrier protein [Oscillospiraceae bacterium MB08-C2-2]
MKEQDITIAEIKDLMQTMSQNRLTSFKMKLGALELELESAPAAGTAQIAAVETVTSQLVASAVPAQAPVCKGELVTSPIVGTFYESPAPDKPAFAKVGQKVKKGDVLFIIESMKLMNEVASELEGTVSEILVENAQGVEFGQPILRIE